MRGGGLASAWLDHDHRPESRGGAEPATVSHKAEVALEERSVVADFDGGRADDLESGFESRLGFGGARVDKSLEDYNLSGWSRTIGDASPDGDQSRLVDRAVVGFWVELCLGIERLAPNGRLRGGLRDWRVRRILLGFRRGGSNHHCPVQAVRVRVVLFGQAFNRIDQGGVVTQGPGSEQPIRADHDEDDRQADQHAGHDESSGRFDGGGDLRRDGISCG